MFSYTTPCNIITLIFFFRWPTEGYTMSVPPTKNLDFAVQKDCSNFSHGISEHLNTPGYPDNYLNGLDCSKVINAGPQFNVVLKFLIFHLEASQGCRYDYVEIRDGMYGFDPLIFRGCARIRRQERQERNGNDIRHGKIFKSTGQYMWIRFISDERISRIGFLANVSGKPRSKTSANYQFECRTVIKGVTSFEIGSSDLTPEFYQYHKKYPDKNVNCIWDIDMPPGSRVFVRITNYTVSHLTKRCISNYIETYDASTAIENVKRRECLTPYTAWVSGASKTILRLYAHSISTLPTFKIIGNIYLPDDTTNCSSETMFKCFDGYCIPRSLQCNHQENCVEGYDEDCTLAKKVVAFRSKYITLFVVVIVGSLLLTTLMTLSEVIQRRRETMRERKKMKQKEADKTTSQRSSGAATPNNVRKENVKPSRDHCSLTLATEDSITVTGTFTSSRLNENVSFRNPRASISVTSKQGSERIYATPHITLPPSSNLSMFPPAPPTPPPPPAPVEEGRGFRLIYDLTNLGKSAAGVFEYPPPPSFLKDDHSTDYTTTSSSSLESLPREPTYDVACLGRKQKVTHNKFKTEVEEPWVTGRLLSSNHRERASGKLAAPKAPATTIRSWTFDDDTDDGAMELTTYISTC